MKPVEQDGDLTLNIDTGSSSTRGFGLGEMGSERYEFFIHQSPNIAARRESEYENANTRTSDRTSLVKFKQGESWCFRIVGEIPGHSGTKTDPNMSKSDELVPKVLAFVGLSLDRIPSIPPDRIQLKLNFMLPISEWADYRDLERDLTRCLTGGFGYNGQMIDFAGADVHGYMEGAGIATTAPTDVTAYIGVCGHKDMNFIAVENGQPLNYPKSKTFEGLGMISIVNSIKHFTDDVQAAQAIFQFLVLSDQPSKEAKAKEALAVLIKSHLLPQKLTDTREKFESTWDEIMRRIDNDRGIGQAQVFFLVGGNARIWNKHFKALFGSRFKSLNIPIRQLSDQYPGMSTQWAYRAIDIWMLHLHTTDRTWSPQRQVVKGGSK